LLHLVAAIRKKKWNGEAENWFFGDEERFTYQSGLQGFSRVPFHLVSPGCTYTTLKHDKPRYFKKIYSTVSRT